MNALIYHIKAVLGKYKIVGHTQKTSKTAMFSNSGRNTVTSLIVPVHHKDCLVFPLFTPEFNFLI